MCTLKSRDDLIADLLNQCEQNNLQAKNQHELLPATQIVYHSNILIICHHSFEWPIAVEGWYGIAN
jgi:hypothetical protein